MGRGGNVAPGVAAFLPSAWQCRGFPFSPRGIGVTGGSEPQREREQAGDKPSGAVAPGEGGTGLRPGRLCSCTKKNKKKGKNNKKI